MRASVVHPSSAGYSCPSPSIRQGQTPATTLYIATPASAVNHLNSDSNVCNLPKPVLRNQHKRLAPCLAAATLTAPPASKASATVPVLPRGETAGAALILDGVTVQAGDRDLLQDVDLRIMPGQRVGFVGANGCGKSTLLRCLYGQRQVDAGRLVLAHNLEVGYLEQTAVSGSDRTVWEEARSRMTFINEAQAAMDKALQELEAGDTRAAARLDKAMQDFERAGGYDADKRIANVLTGLGFRQDQWDKKASEFSGGWQMRIALARLLLSPAGQAAQDSGLGGLLLLDEPTNHLDSAACKWLANFLKTSGGTLLLVSHDEDMLEGACDHIVEVRGRKLHWYAGSYSKFLELRAERQAQAAATAAAQQAEIARVQEFVDRFGAKASKASQAQSRAKLLEKLKEEAIEVSDIPAAAKGPGDARKVSLKLPRAPPCYTDVLTVKGGSVGWGAPTDGAQPLLQNVNFVIKKGQRLLVLGPNGAGKSTLIKTLAGKISLWQGDLKIGEGVQMSYFSQDLAQDLPLDMPALDYVIMKAQEHDPTITIEKCRQALGALGITGSMALAQIGVLSGGEKARVALAAFALVPCNVLLLDEASNHLDLQTIDVLTGALQDFGGAILAITHNKAFAESLNATHILRVADGKVTMADNLGLTDKDFEHKSTAAAAPPAAKSNTASKASSPPAKQSKPAPATASAPPPAPAPAPASAKPTRKKTTLSFKEKQEYDKLSKDMQTLQTKQAKLQSKIDAAGGNFKSTEQVYAELGTVTAQLEEMELRWLELAELAGDI